MFGIGKAKTPDVHPVDLFRASLNSTIAAARSRHVSMRTIAEVLQGRADVMKRQAAINYTPTKIDYSINRPQ